MVGAVQAAVIILAIVAALLAVGLVAVAWSRRATRRRLTATDAKLTATEETLEATRSTLTETEIEAGRATTRAEAETSRASAAETEAAEARTRADDAERDATEARDELERVRASGGDASVLGGLEAVRITRLWRDVAGAADPPPVATDDEVEAALNVLAVVSREASGTTVAVDWKRTTPVPPAAALLVVRIAEELIASVKHADRATLEVGEATTPTEGEGEGGTAVTVRILSDPATPLPEGLAEVLGSTGWVTSSDPGEVEVRLPA
jgi:hypothetical protein